MSQADIGNITAGQTGPDFFDNKLEPWRNALHSMHSGASRPAYALAGLMWLDTTTTPWIVKCFDGTEDITIGTINATTNTFAPAGIPFTAASAAGPSSLDFFEDTDNGANKITISAPTALGADRAVSFADASGIVVLDVATQNMTNKTHNSTNTFNQVIINQPNIVGVTTNSNAAAGSVGEFLSATVLAGAALSLTDNTAANVTSLALTAGDWDVEGIVVFTSATTTSYTQRAVSISLTSAVFGGVGAVGTVVQTFAAYVPNGRNGSINTGRTRISLSSTTTIYLVAFANFTVAAATGYGQITARRVR
jgi:hypothetical protein